MRAARARMVVRIVQGEVRRGLRVVRGVLRLDGIGFLGEAGPVTVQGCCKGFAS